MQRLTVPRIGWRNNSENCQLRLKACERASVFILSIMYSVFVQPELEMGPAEVSGTATVSDQKSYIKIETLRGSWLEFPDLWSGQKPWWNWCLTPVANFALSPKGPVSQIHSPPPRWCPWDLFRSFKVRSDDKERVGCGKQREATALIKSLVKLQPWFLSLRWKTCLPQNCSLGFSACSEGPAFGQNTDDDYD